MALAGAKARGAQLLGESGLLLAADTVVATGEELLGKPRDREAARRCLARLRGRRHEVWTAVVTCPVLEGRFEEGSLEEVVIRSLVEMRRIPAEDLERYLDSGEWRGKAGGYGIQGPAADFMKLVEGPLDNVIGLPLDAVRAAFDRYLRTS